MDGGRREGKSMRGDVTRKRGTDASAKRDNGNSRVTHAGGQLHPMQGSDTDGRHALEVHPCQTRSDAYWNDLLAPDERGSTGPGRDGEKPWWSSKSWKRSSEVRRR